MFLTNSMNTKPLFFLFLVLLLSSCGSGLKVIGSNKANGAFSAKDIIQIHKKASPNFTTLAARIQVSYEDEKKAQSITVSLRMEKDENIWIKASLLGITLSKVLITPNRVSYYETITNTYFDGDFALLSKWLGVEINFEKAQAILLGQSIFNLNASEYASMVVQNKYKLQPKQQPQNFIHTLVLYPENFKVDSVTLSQPNDKRLLIIKYGEYQNLEGSFYPSEIVINSEEEGGNTKCELNYKKIDLNVSVSFPFTIPQGYEKIQFN